MKKNSFHAFSHILYFVGVGSQIDSDPGLSSNTYCVNLSDGWPKKIGQRNRRQLEKASSPDPFPKKKKKPSC